MKKLFFILSLTLLMCACAPKSYYQLYKVSTDELELKNNQLTYENEHCIVSYNLWGENGDLSFRLYNKTDKDMFVVMPQSFFIQNDMAYDYYTNAVHISRSVFQTGKSTTTASSIYSIVKADSYAQTATLENSTTTKEMIVICIPPKAAKFFNGFHLITSAYKDCDDYDFNYPKKATDVITYAKEDSPWTFRNRIAYTFDEGSENCEYIDNELWVSYLQNYYYSAMQKQIKVIPCELQYPTFQTLILNKAPNAFYNKYTKTMGATKSRTSIGKERVRDEIYR